MAPCALRAPSRVIVREQGTRARAERLRDQPRPRQATYRPSLRDRHTQSCSVRCPRSSARFSNSTSSAGVGRCGGAALRMRSEFPTSALRMDFAGNVTASEHTNIRLYLIANDCEISHKLILLLASTYLGSAVRKLPTDPIPQLLVLAVVPGRLDRPELGRSAAARVPTTLWLSLP